MDINVTSDVTHGWDEMNDVTTPEPNVFSDATSFTMYKIGKSFTMYKIGKCVSFFSFFKFFVGPRPSLWSHWLLLFWTLCVLPHGFQIQSGSRLHSFLLAVILKCSLHAELSRGRMPGVLTGDLPFRAQMLYPLGHRGRLNGLLTPDMAARRVPYMHQQRKYTGVRTGDLPFRAQTLYPLGHRFLLYEARDDLELSVFRTRFAKFFRQNAWYSSFPKKFH